MSENTKLPLASPDPVVDLLAQLREAAPQVFSEAGIDFDKLKAALGGHVDAGPERYGLTWAGKSDAFRNVQAPSVGTLLPMPEESVDWDNTENLIIEGDNLEVLKLLQKPYHGKVKMIYIDPPYNTGNEFIYPDNYREGLEDYLRYSGQISDEGIKQSTNTEISGRFHSNWLSMMYPRLFLARNLLRNDGVIFVSIDDNEVHNLRMLMNEVFGEENFLANIVWQKRYVSNATAKYLSDMHDHILVYARLADHVKFARISRTEEQIADYKNPDSDPRGPWRAQDLSASKPYRAGEFEITTPAGLKVSPPPSRYWRCNREQYEEWLADGRIWFGKSGAGRPMLKAFLSEVQQGITPNTWWEHEFASHNKAATLEIKALFDGASPFDTPKPAKLIRRMLELTTAPNDDIWVLDFFAGSGTTAHAVLELNHEDQGSRRFIAIQLPERVDNSTYSNIAHITRERVRRVITKLDKEDDGKLALEGQAKPDRGFRAFKLSSSNFKIWDADKTPDDPGKLAEQLKLYADNVERKRGPQDILYELILKSGLLLSSKVEKIDVAGKPVWSINDGKYLILLDNKVNREVLRGMLALKPQQILCLDTAFGDDDALKTNTVLEAKSRGVAFHTV